MRTLTFRCIQIDETKYWSFEDKPDDLRIYGIYMFLEGSATYLCSLTPSSWLEWIAYEAHTDDDAWREMFHSEHATPIEDPSYYASYISPDFVRAEASNAYTVEIEEKDEIVSTFDDPALEAAWEEAREYFQGNAPQFPT